MNTTLHIAETVLPLLVMLALGMLCRRKALFTAQGIAAFKSLIVHITLPAVMFLAFAKADYTPESAMIPVTIFAACALAMLLGFAACRLPWLRGRLTPYLATGFEAGMLGYALFALLFPDQSAAPFAIVDLGQVLFVFTVYKAMLAGHGGLKGTLREALRSPVIWAILAGLLVGVSGLYAQLVRWQVGGVVDRIADFIAAPTGAVILLVIGYELVPSQIKWRKTAAFIGMRLLIMGALFAAVLFINRALLNHIIHEGALALLFILPPPFVLPIFADTGEEQADIASALSTFTLVSLLLFTVLTVVFA